MQQQVVPLLIGHTGKMGAMLMARWKEAGYTPLGADRELQADGTLALCPNTVRQQAVKATVVVLCVPVTALQETLSVVVPCLTSGQILADITSVKTWPMQWMQAAYTGPVVGTHPLFGPVPLAEDMRVVLTPGDVATDAHCRVIEMLFTRMGCSVFRATAQEHDTGVGFAQSLNFAVCASFFATLARQEGVRPFLTPSFKRLMEAARKHLTQDTAMFCEFSNANPYFHDILQTYHRILDETEERGLDAIAAEAAVWYHHDL